MSASSPRVVVTRRLPAPVEARMRELFDVELSAEDKPLSTDKLIAAVADADVLVPAVGDPVDSRVIEAAGPRLKLVANFGVGVDHIDVAAAHAKGIIVTNTPGVLTEDAADLTMALIVAASRRMSEGVRGIMRGDFPGWSPAWMLGRSLSGAALGIVGMGRIGQAVARRARAFGMKIHYHNRKPVSVAIEESLEATFHQDLADLLRITDVLLVNCPRTPATYHLISRKRLAMLRPHACVVNTSRGDVIDESALADLLEEGRIAGAALDVFERPGKPNLRLKELPNVLLTPQMATATVESRTAMGEKVIINIRVWQDGSPPPDRVLPEEAGV